MEDYSKILWLLVIVGSAIASFVTKRKPKQSDQTEHETTWQDIFGIPKEDQTPIPNEEEDEYIFEEPKSRPIVVKSTQRVLDKQVSSQEKSESPLQRELNQLKKVENRAFTPMSAQPTTTLETTTTSSGMQHDVTAPHLTSKKQAIMDGFELRKAVLWAEILKPKFNDK